jgi:hypothetical protein
VGGTLENAQARGCQTVLAGSLFDIFHNAGLRRLRLASRPSDRNAPGSNSLSEKADGREARDKGHRMVEKEGRTGVGRRQLFQLATAGAALSNSASLAATASPSEVAAGISPQPQPAPRFDNDLNTSDILGRDTDHVGRDPCVRNRGRRHRPSDRGITQTAGSHRLSACAIRKPLRSWRAAWQSTGRLGVCIGTTGPTFALARFDKFSRGGSQVDARPASAHLTHKILSTDIPKDCG